MLGPWQDARVEQRSPAWTGTVVLGDGVLVYAGPAAQVEHHVHDAVQLVVALGRPLVVDAGAPVVTSAALISSRTPHALHSCPDPVALVLVEPRGPRGRSLRALGDLVGGRELDERLGDPSPPGDDETPERLLEWADELLARLVGGDQSSRDADVTPPIRDALRLVERALPGAVRLGDVASDVAISPSRLTHRFRAEVGMPFRRYVVWARLRRAALLVQGGSDLTTAAATAGFADSAHLSRTFRSLFGLPPSEALSSVRIVSRHDRIVQAEHSPDGVP